MPATLSNLRENSKNARITFSKDDYIDVTYFPHRINQDMLDRYQEAAADKDYDLAASIFGEVVTAWDLRENEHDEEPMPFNGQTFRIIGTGIMNDIWDHLTDAITPKSRKQSRRP